MAEMKKNSLEKLAEERISEPENISTEIIILKNRKKK